MKYLLPVIAFVVLLLDSSLAEPWEKLSQAEANRLGWSLEKLEEAEAYSRSIATEAVVLVVAGKELKAWGAVDQKFNVHSIRKSFLSALYGIQVDAGRIRLDATMQELGIDDNAPSLTDSEKKATVRQLLQARSGIYHPALYETQRMKELRPERHRHPPGSHWYYNNWDFNALGSIYEQQCGSGIYEDFDRLIAQPLGMEAFTPSDGQYVTGSDSEHRAYPFRMTARDMARFGLLYLRDGRWNDQQLVPERWVEESTTSYSDAGVSGGYGYLWWIARGNLHLPGVTLPEGTYSARGSGGHYIVIVPSLDLVVVHRVNTDVKGREVTSAEFGELIRLILNACEPQGEATWPLLMNRYRVPGAAIIELNHRSITSERYLGVVEARKDRPVTPETNFEVASMSKPLLAHIAMHFVEAGMLDLDRPLHAYLDTPYLPDEPLHHRITAGMVLNHTSGFPNWRPKGGQLRVHHQPGTAYRYSGEGMVYLQRVLEHLTAEDYEHLARRILLDPLGMTRSSHVWSDLIAEHAAAGHDGQGKVIAPRRTYSTANAAYSLYTTPRDYAAWIIEMMSPTLLKPTSIEQMLTPSSPPTDRPLLERQGSTGSGSIRYGLGWSIEPTVSGPRVRHSGSNGTGFRSFVEFDPDSGYGLLVFTNSSGGQGFWEEVVRRLAKP